MGGGGSAVTALGDRQFYGFPLFVYNSEETRNSDVDPNACRSSCAEAFCGDGVVDTGELCDDRNTVSGDGCSAECRIETE